jgi:cyanate permease
MLALFSGAQLTNAVGQINFYGISHQLIHEHKSATLWWVTYLNMVPLASYVIFSPLSVWLIEFRGTRESLAIGVLLQLAGSVLRMFINYHFMYLVIGQTIFTIG